MAKLTRAAPEIAVKDMEAALAYYGDRLGFRLMSTTPERAYAVVQRDDVALHLFSDAVAAPASLHVFVDGLDELHAELKGRGARLKQDIEAKPWGLRDFRVLDCDGNELKFSAGA
jgi:catechol 2,3-dioxygenase-like lactoylglutathione lyase family enzyme